ncbi:Sec-independent protein translocase protein TatB [Zhongshania borealis]|uniref:Sec-independent protein translocase protein TatB n=1 Tax=Zhongshania borealis TaxID=889488 RepID=A0ABP7WRH4_9GAMM
MFDVSFLEIVIIAIVGLLVLGPERLPGAVRTGTLYVGRIKRSIKRLRDEIEIEIGAKEIRASLVDDSALKIEKDLADLKKNYYRVTDYASDSSSLVKESALEESRDDGDSDLLQHARKDGVPEL